MVCEMLYIMSTILSLAGHRDTWAFLERRIKDAVDCRKTAQEASQLAQAVSMGLSNSVSSLFSKGLGSQKF
ncbi:hypothetical protein M758_4G069100 [Ceratodon purpureus]|nr:hypothetical protein M758_4G069100 [Ceratodon purpureus]